MRQVLEKIRKLHAEVDEQAQILEAVHAQRLVCRKGCSACCVDGLTVFEVEAERIRHEAASVLEQEPHPAGKCAFLDPVGACRIYEARPYVCRTQGLPLRWFDAYDLDGNPGEEDAWFEYRDICPLNENEEPIEALEEEDCWTIGPTEERLAELAEEHVSQGARVALRDLFRTNP